MSEIELHIGDKLLMTQDFLDDRIPNFLHGMGFIPTGYEVGKECTIHSLDKYEGAILRENGGSWTGAIPIPVLQGMRQAYLDRKANPNAAN